MTRTDTLPLSSVQRTVLALFVVFALLLYTPYVILGVRHFSSPDETQNAFFASTFRTTGTVTITEPLNAVADGMVHPRGMSMLPNNRLAPGSFLGLPILAGLLGKIAGVIGSMLLVPLVSAAAVGGFFFLLRPIFGTQSALLSSFVLAILPPFWIYALKGFWHNGLFVSLILLAFIPLTRVRRRFPELYGVAAGVALGLALAVRTVEVLWLCVVVGVILLLRRKEFHWRFLVWFFLAAAATLLPILFVQRGLYGSFFAVAYSQSSLDTASFSSFASSVWSKLSLVFFPFGFDFGTSLWRFLTYSSVLGVYGVLLLFGLIVTWRSTRTWQPRVYLLLYGFVALWLINYYGPLNIAYEHLGDDAVNIGSSYFRFWLPIYVFGVPFIVLAMQWISRRVIRRAVPFFILFLCATSVVLVVQDEQYGLKKNLSDSRLQDADRAMLLEKTEDNAVILAGVYDKVYFPERKVIGWDPSRSTTFLPRTVRALTPTVPLYYAAPETLTLVRSSEVLAPYDLFFKQIATLPSGIPLYRLQKIEPDSDSSVRP